MSALAEAVGLDPARLERLLHDCAAREWTVAAAESLTGGLLTAVLTSIPGSSAVVRGGLVVYATELKASLAGVDPDLLARTGPVDPEVAAGLARGAAQRCRATIGLGLTGVAGPAEQDGRPVGTVHVALVGPDGPSAVTLAPDPTGRDRDTIRAAAVRAGIQLLAEAVGKA